MLCRLGSLTWRHSTYFNTIQKATYASFSNFLIVSAPDVSRVLKMPLPGINILSVNTNDTWAKWSKTRDEPQETKKQHEQKCISELRQLLQEVHEDGRFSKVTLKLNDVLELPIQHAESKESPSPLIRRSPVSVFEALDVECVCQDVGIWSLTDLPIVEISDPMTRCALLKAREFGKDIHAWHDFVSKNPDPLFQAFDYTADFNSRDLDQSHSEKTLIDLGVFGQGYPCIDGVDIDSFSVIFSDHLEGNVTYFKSNPWKIGMYDEIRSRDGRVFAQAGKVASDEESGLAKVLFDRPIWQIPPEFVRDFVARLNVGEDEELVYEERTVSKRKKTKDGSE